MNYLPKAFAFIYVIDVSHAGGMQKYLKEMVSGCLFENPVHSRKFVFRPLHV